jgi:hypothetical protein
MTPTRQQKGAATAIGMPWSEYLTHLAAGERWCHACRRWRDQSLFRLRRAGQGARHSHCADCYRDYMREYMRRGVRVVNGARR